MRRYRRDEPGGNWPIARAVLRQVLSSLGVADVDRAIGTVRFLGEGLSYRAYRAECRLQTTPGESSDLVVRLPRADCSDDLVTSAQREAELLQHLSTLDLPIRLPRVLGTVPVEHGTAIVQEMVYGAPLDPRGLKFRPQVIWEATEQAASVCHGVDTGLIPKIVPRHTSRRAHARAAIKNLAEIEIPEAKDVQQWAIEQLPPDDPPALLHGDLVGQNLLFSFDDEPLGIIDWAEARIGDAAYDLAIVTRGKRQSFQIADGLQRLLDVYNTRVQRPLTAPEVHLHELCLVAGLYQADARQYGVGSPGAENARATLRNLLHRVDQATAVR